MSPDPTARDAYATNADGYISLLGTIDAVHHDDLELIARRLTIRPGVVLDAGCGPGHLTDHLRSLGVETIGIDQVPEFIEHALKAFPSSRFELGTIGRLPVPDHSVAGILAWYSLIHLRPDQIDDVLAELRRVTAPGGTLVVGFFDGDQVDAFDHRVVTAYRWPVEELSARLRQAGFVEVERQQRPGVDEAGRRPHAAVVAVAA